MESGAPGRVRQGILRPDRRFPASGKREGKTIYPPGPLIFNAFRLTPFDNVKVVILGQDPYHGPGQAHGLSFSVQDGVALPPSLQNIYKEITADTGAVPPASGNLERWARQGVFLLNSVLTVRAGSPTSHSGIGWQTFTDAVIKTISDKKNASCSCCGAITQEARSRL